MRYFTRERFSQNQDQISASEDSHDSKSRLKTASVDWVLANERYLEYISAVRNELPKEVKSLVDLGLHDAVIKRASSQAEHVEILFDTTNCPFLLNTTELKLIFEGVTKCLGLNQAIGQWLLYEEVYVANAIFEYSALLEKSEVLICFEEVRIFKCN
jgi:hypothetical protein